MKSTLPRLRLIAFYVLLFSGLTAVAQIPQKLNNPSFEGQPRNSTFGHNIQGATIVIGWTDWMLFTFRSSPDVHGTNTLYWNVQTKPYHGKTFIGLVTREDETWECMGQKLPVPLQGQFYYDLVLHLCQDINYASPTKSSTEPVLYSSPTIVRVWGSNAVGELAELLAETDPVTHQDWREYTLYLRPQADFDYLVIEAFYPVDYHGATNGHVLIDNAKLLQYK